MGQVKVGERGLIWALMHGPERALRGPGSSWKTADLEGLATPGDPAAGAIPAGMARRGHYLNALIERLSKGEAALVQEIARQAGAPADRGRLCADAEKLRFDRERAECSAKSTGCRKRAHPATISEIDALWERKKDLLQRHRSWQ